MRLTGRLGGHFLRQVFVLLMALGTVFIVWAVVSSVWVLNAERGGSTVSTTPAVVLSTAEQSTTRSAEGSITVGEDALARVDELQGWLQVLDAEGHEIYAYAKPSEVPTYYPAGRLVYLRNSPGEIGQRQLSTWYSTEAGELTWVFGTPVEYRTPLERAVPGPAGILQAFLALFIAGGVATIGIAWASGRRLARPLEHMMDWIATLAKGDYAEPLDRKGVPASRHRDGRLRRPYRTYREVVASLQTLTDQLGRAEAERQRLEQTRDEWVTGVSHDLRTPLSSVRGYGTLLASDYELDADEIRGYGRIISEQSDNMERLIEDLALTFRLKTDALPLALVATDLVELTREAAIALANDPRSAGHSVVFDVDASVPRVIADVDPAWFSRALSNLLVNAVIHNPDGTTVTVSVCRQDDLACVDVRDDGVGMDAETQARLFDRYYRGTASSSDASGTGLGMAIARQLVEANGGTVGVASTPGVGTVMRVCVPLAAPS